MISDRRAQSAMRLTWVVVAVTMMGQMGTSFINSGLASVYPFIKEDFGLSLAEVGLIASGLTLGGLPTNLLLGMMVDALGVRLIVTVSTVLCAALVLVFSQTQVFFQAVLVGLLLGAASSGVYPAVMKAIMDWVREGTRGIAMGVQQTSVPIAGITAALLLPFLATHYSWRYATMALALMILVSGLFVLVFYRDHPHASSQKWSWSSSLKGMTRVAGDRDILLVSLCGITAMALHAVFAGYLILFLKDEMGMSAIVGGYFLAVAQASSATCRIGWGLASDFVFHGRRVVTLALMGILSVLSMILMVWLPSDASPLLVGVVVFLVAGSFMGWPGIWPVLLAELAGSELTGTAVGFGMIITRVGSFGIPPLFGFVVDQTGSYDMGWWMMAGVAAASPLLLALLSPEGRRH